MKNAELDLHIIQVSWVTEIEFPMSGDDGIGTGIFWVLPMKVEQWHGDARKLVVNGITLP